MKYVECPAERTGAGPDILLFLGGGITNCPDWQKEMVHKLSGTNLTLLNPRRAEFDVKNPNIAVEQIEWEHRHLTRSDAILFWFPSETLCPIVLYELGAWNFRPKKLFIGVHPQYQRKLDVEVQTRLERVGQVIAYSLDDLAAQVIEWAARKEADRFVRDPEQPPGRKE